MSSKAKTSGATVPAAPAAPAAVVAKSVSEMGDDESLTRLLVEGGFVDGSEETEGGPEAADAEAEAAPEEAEEEAPAETESEETEVEAPAEEAEQDQEEDEAIEGLDPALQAKIDKAMHRKHARMKAAEQAVETERAAREAAEAKLAELEAAPPGAASRRDDPLGNVSTVEALRSKAEEAEGLLEWVDDNLARLKRNPQAVEAQLKAAKIELPEGDYSPEAMEEWLSSRRRGIDKTLRIHIPKREKFLQEQTRADVATMAEFPFWKNPKSPEYVLAQEVLKSMPEIKSRPNWRAFTTLGVLGAMKLQELRTAAAAKAKSAAGATPRSKIPPRVPGARKVAVPTPDPAKANKAAAVKRFHESGSDKDLTSVISTLLD